MRRTFLHRTLRWMTATVATLSLGGRHGVRSQSTGAITGFDHVAAPMLKVAEMVRFYRALGFEVREGERICSVHCGDHKINFHLPALWQSQEFALRAPAAQPPCGDFCFVWEGNQRDLLNALANAGAAVIEGPAERVGGRDAGRAKGVSHYVRDPDGNLLEFIRY